MLKKIVELFSGILATIVSGVFLLASLFIPIIFEVKIPIYFDPAWVSVFISGLPLVYKAVKKLIKNKGIGKISSAFLITIAMIAAVAIGDVFAAGEVACIMALGEILEDLTTDRAKKGLKKLIALAPVQGRKLVDGKETLVPAEEIAVGDILRILPGETVPVDGVVVSGQSSVDQSVLTGESLPVDKEVGDEAYCGTINRFGTMDIRATKVGEDSSLQKLIRMVKDAEKNKAPMQRTADKWASWLVPVALLIAVIAGLAMRDIVVAVTVLVVFCPCALVLATPTAIMAAIGQATKHGVIIKSGEALEKLNKVDVVAFDKTGTLTFGKLTVSDVLPFDEEISETQLLTLAAAAEQRSEHPLGKAIVAHANAQEITPLAAENFRMEAGKGVSVTVSGKTVLCGNAKYLTENGVTLSEKATGALDRFQEEGKASVLVAREERILGVIALSDVLRPTAKRTVEGLGKAGVNTLLLTGDNARTANYFAAQAGVDEVKAELLPEEKVENILSLQKAGKKVCMIGDGVNDAPALKTATVGVAMGAMGSDIAVEAADVALMGDDISKLPYLKRLARATVRTIKFSIGLSLLINFAAIVLSLLGLLTPTTGALVHNAGSFFVILIAALLYDRKLDK